MDDEHCDMCRNELNYNKSGAVKIKLNHSYSTTIYILCSDCCDLVDEYIQDCRNAT